MAPWVWWEARTHPAHATSPGRVSHGPHTLCTAEQVAQSWESRHPPDTCGHLSDEGRPGLSLVGPGQSAPVTALRAPGRVLTGPAGQPLLSPHGGGGNVRGEDNLTTMYVWEAEGQGFDPSGSPRTRGLLH